MGAQLSGYELAKAWRIGNGCNQESQYTGIQKSTEKRFSLADEFSMTFEWENYFFCRKLFILLFDLINSTYFLCIRTYRAPPSPHTTLEQGKLLNFVK